MDIPRILSTKQIRDRASAIASLSEKGETNFRINHKALETCADFVAEVTKRSYPNLEIPFHSRWKHFQVTGVDRIGRLPKPLDVRAKLDLVILSVLLDAGAGTRWKYKEKDGTITQRSEGLAVASLEMFLNGLFSSTLSDPHQVNAEKLKKLTLGELSDAFQVTAENPLDGLPGRLDLLHGVASALQKETTYFPKGRPGDLLDYFLQNFPNRKIQATDILLAIQKSLNSIWPGRIVVDGFKLGDVWRYSKINDDFDSLIPFHKLPQWLTYSVVDPLEEAGFEIQGFENLSGLAEYRNGGLLIDMGVLEIKDPTLITQKHRASSDVIIEWRALTIFLLDLLAPKINERLGTNLPLGKILEGGTWSAGRKIAQEKRPDASPPLQLDSDGTVF